MTSGSYTIEKKNRFFSAVAALVEGEIDHPGYTMTLIHLVDLSKVRSFRNRAAENNITKPSITAFVVKALALAMREFPGANRRIFRWPFCGPRLVSFHQVDTAVLVERNIPDTPMATFCDVIRRTDELSLSEITEQLRLLAQADLENNAQWRAFSRTIRWFPTWLSKRLIGLPTMFPRLWIKFRGGACAVSSPGKYGVDIIAGTWPWSVGVSFGYVSNRLIERDAIQEMRPSFYLTVNWDRRLMAGAQFAQFFRRMVEILENPEREMVPYPAPKSGWHAEGRVESDPNSLRHPSSTSTGN